MSFHLTLRRCITKYFKSLIISLILLLTAGTIVAQDISPNHEQLKAWQQFRRSVNGEIFSHWDENTGALKMLKGRIPLRREGETLPSRDLLERFFQSHRAIWNINPMANTLSFQWEKQNRNTLVLGYQQHYQGIPVFRHGYRVRLSSTDELIYMAGKFNSNISLPSITPSISAKQAEELAASHVNTTAGEVENLQSKLVIFSADNASHLVWKVYFEVYTTPAAWLILVNASDGSVLLQENHMAEVTGSGDAYTSHPANGSPTQKSLYFLNTSGYLDGTYVKTNNEDAANAFNSGYQFFFSPSYTSFDEVNVYYHVTQMQNNFFKALDPSYNPTKRNATVHYLTNHNNAYASPSGTLLFGDGDGVSYQDFAKEESVIYHENTHVVISDVSNLGYNISDERGAIHEGLSDYYAASFSTESVAHRIGEWVRIGSGDIRNLENSATYNGYFL